MCNFCPSYLTSYLSLTVFQIPMVSSIVKSRQCRTTHESSDGVGLLNQCSLSKTRLNRFNSVLLKCVVAKYHGTLNLQVNKLLPLGSFCNGLVQEIRICLMLTNYSFIVNANRKISSHFRNRRYCAKSDEVEATSQLYIA